MNPELDAVNSLMLSLLSLRSALESGNLEEIYQARADIREILSSEGAALFTN